MKNKKWLLSLTILQNSKIISPSSEKNVEQSQLYLLKKNFVQTFEQKGGFIL